MLVFMDSARPLHEEIKKETQRKRKVHPDDAADQSANPTRLPPTISPSNIPHLVTSADWYPPDPEAEVFDDLHQQSTDKQPQVLILRHPPRGHTGRRGPLLKSIEVDDSQFEEPDVPAWVKHLREAKRARKEGRPLPKGAKSKHRQKKGEHEALARASSAENELPGGRFPSNLPEPVVALTEHSNVLSSNHISNADTALGISNPNPKPATFPGQYQPLSFGRFSNNYSEGRDEENSTTFSDQGQVNFSDNCSEDSMGILEPTVECPTLPGREQSISHGRCPDIEMFDTMPRYHNTNALLGRATSTDIQINPEPSPTGVQIRTVYEPVAESVCTLYKKETTVDLC